MTFNIVQTLRNKQVFEVSRLIGNARNYINNDSFINLLNQYDLNSNKNDRVLIQQFNMFLGVPGLNEQIDKWLSS
jgi:hypothetical protein